MTADEKKLGEDVLAEIEATHAAFVAKYPDGNTPWNKDIHFDSWDGAAAAYLSAAANHAPALVKELREAREEVERLRGQAAAAKAFIGRASCHFGAALCPCCEAIAVVDRALEGATPLVRMRVMEDGRWMEYAVLAELSGSVEALSQSGTEEKGGTT